MLTEDKVIALGALFDGELPEDEAAQLREFVRNSQEAQRHLANLAESRRLIRTGMAIQNVPEWHDVRRRLDSRSQQRRSKISRWGLGVIASTAVALGSLSLILKSPVTDSLSAKAPQTDLVEMVETDLENTVPVVYLDQPSGWTVVWVIEEADSSDG